MKELHPLDIRNRTKEEALWILFRAEMTYLMSRGWEMLCGCPEPYHVAPGDDYRSPECKLYTHDEAVKIQKEKDGWFDV